MDVLPLPRVTATLRAIDIANRRPVTGQKLAFIDDTDVVFDEHEAFADAAVAWMTQGLALADAMNALADEAGVIQVCDVDGAARGSPDYVKAIRETPVTMTDLARARRLLVIGIAPDGAAPLSAYCYPELGEDGVPRWGGRLSVAGAAGVLS